MKEVKTAELIGPALDWAVAKCEGKVEQGVYGTPEIRDGGMYLHYCDVVLSDCYAPATNWAQGGPIIEREHLEFDFRKDTRDYACWNGYRAATGPTHLIAAMRCCVRAKMGDTIEIPEELLT